jgi:hypothetical protein
MVLVYPLIGVILTIIPAGFVCVCVCVCNLGSLCFKQNLSLYTWKVGRVSRVSTQPAVGYSPHLKKPLSKEQQGLTS